MENCQQKGKKSAKFVNVSPIYIMMMSCRFISEKNLQPRRTTYIQLEYSVTAQLLLCYRWTLHAWDPCERGQKHVRAKNTEPSCPLGQMQTIARECRSDCFARKMLLFIFAKIGQFLGKFAKFIFLAIFDQVCKKCQCCENFGKGK